jgi:hypothetical protein
MDLIMNKLTVMCNILLDFLQFLFVVLKLCSYLGFWMFSGGRCAVYA